MSLEDINITFHISLTYKTFHIHQLITRFYSLQNQGVVLDFMSACGEVLFTFFRDSPSGLDADDAAGGDHSGVDGALRDDCFAAGGEDGEDVCGGLYLCQPTIPLYKNSG